MFYKKNSIIIGCLLALLLIVAGCGSKSVEVESQNKPNDGNQNKTEASESPITLKLATYTPAESHYTDHYLKPFMEEVTRLTDGRVQFEFYPGGQLGNGADTINIVSGGVADVSIFTPSYHPNEMPLGANMIGIPGLVEPSVNALMAYAKVNQQSPMLETDFLRHGVRPVSFYMNPPYEFYTNGTEIKVPEDLKGLKIKAAGGVYNEALNYFGATPVSMTISEVYSAFSTGVVDGLHYYNNVVKSSGFDELTKFVTRGANFGTLSSGLLINEEVWQSLPKDIQEIILQVGEDVGKSFTEYVAADALKIFEEWKKSGEITVYELSDDEKKQWENSGNEFRKHFLENMKNEELVKALEMLNEELEKLK